MLAVILCYKSFIVDEINRFVQPSLLIAMPCKHNNDCYPKRKSSILFSPTSLLRTPNPYILLFSYLRSKTSAAWLFICPALAWGGFSFKMDHKQYVLLLSIAFLLFYINAGQTGMDFAILVTTKPTHCRWILVWYLYYFEILSTLCRPVRACFSISYRLWSYVSD